MSGSKFIHRWEIWNDITPSGDPSESMFVGGITNGAVKLRVYEDEIDENEDDLKELCEKANMHDDLVDVLRECKTQIEYLHSKFKETGSGNAVLAKIEKLIAEADRI